MDTRTPVEEAYWRGYAQAVRDVDEEASEFVLDPTGGEVVLAPEPARA